MQTYRQRQTIIVTAMPKTIKACYILECVKMIFTVIHRCTVCSRGGKRQIHYL